MTFAASPPRHQNLTKEKSVKTSMCLLLPAVLMLGGPVRAADDAVGPSASEVRAVIDKGIAYLKSRQGADGSFSPKVAGPGVTGLVAATLAAHSGAAR